MQKGLNFKSNAATIIVMILFATLYITNMVGVGHSATPQATLSPTPLHSLILSFEGANHVWSVVLAGTMLTIASIYAMRLSIRSNILGTPSFLPTLTYTAVVVNIANRGDMLTPLIVANMVNFALANLYEIGGKSGVGYKLFASAFWLGFIPLLYPSTLPMLVLILGIIVLFDCDLLEMLAVIMGLALPMLASSYTGWLLFRGGFFAGLSNLFEAFSRGAVPIDWGWGWCITLCVALIAALYSILNVNDFSIAEVARTRIIFTAIVVIVIAATLLSPTFAPTQLTTLAMPASILISSALLNLQRRWSLLLYIIVILSTLVAPFLP